MRVRAWAIAARCARWLRSCASTPSAAASALSCAHSRAAAAAAARAPSSVAAASAARSASPLFTCARSQAAVTMPASQTHLQPRAPAVQRPHARVFYSVLRLRPWAHKRGQLVHGGTELGS